MYSNIIQVEEGAEREYVGPHLTTLAEQQTALAGVLAKLVCRTRACTTRCVALR